MRCDTWSSFLKWVYRPYHRKIPKPPRHFPYCGHVKCQAFNSASSLERAWVGGGILGLKLKSKYKSEPEANEFRYFPAYSPDNLICHKVSLKIPTSEFLLFRMPQVLGNKLSHLPKKYSLGDAPLG